VAGIGRHRCASCGRAGALLWSFRWCACSLRLRLVGRPAGVASPTRRHEEVCIPSKIASDVSSRGHGPRKTLLRLNLDGMTPDERSAWVEEARVEAVLGSCKLSLKSLRSGYRCYRAFAGASCTPPPFMRPFADACWRVMVGCMCREDRAWQQLSSATSFGDTPGMVKTVSV